MDNGATGMSNLKKADLQTARIIAAEEFLIKKRWILSHRRIIHPDSHVTRSRAELIW
jgi:hypothetical protein